MLSTIREATLLNLSFIALELSIVKDICETDLSSITLLLIYYFKISFTTVPQIYLPHKTLSKILYILICLQISLKLYFLIQTRKI
jgi:hypothetical protein